MQLKALLKTVKLYESTISMILGALVLAIASFLVVSYFRNLKVGQTTGIGVQNETSQVITTHTVTEGETLWSISEKYYEDGFSWKKIADANSISNPADIEKGTQLTIPDFQESEIEQTQSAIDSIEQTSIAPIEESGLIIDTTTTTASPASITSNTYTVAKGDSLWSIAVRAYGDGYKWTEVAKANNLKDPNIIFTGVSLVLPR